MAREFDGASDWLTLASGLSIGANDPIWLSGWFWVDVTNVTQVLASIGVDGSTNNRRDLILNASGPAIQARSVDNAGTVRSASSTVTSGLAGAWFHVLAEWGSATSRAVTVNGGTRATNAQTATLGSAPNQIRIGATHTAASPLNGRAAAVALFSGTPTADQRRAAALGLHPLLISPSTLIEAWDLGGRVSPEPGWKGNALTLTGAPTFAESPRLYRPRGRSLVVVPDVGGGGVEGTVAATAAAATAAASGTPIVTGTGQAQAPAATASASGAPVSTGSAAAQAPAPTAAASGAPVVSGTAAGQAQTPTASASGTPVASGSAAAQAPSATAAASGAPVVTGSAAAQAPTPTVSANDSQDATGTVSAQAPAATASASGTPIVTGTGQAQAPAPTIAATGAPVGSGSAAAQAPASTASASGTPVGMGSAAAQSPAPTATAAGAPVITGSVAATAPAPTVVAVETAAPVYTRVRVTAETLRARRAVSGERLRTAGVILESLS